MSLPIIDTRVSASGPLPISVAPLTACPSFPFSILHEPRNEGEPEQKADSPRWLPQLQRCEREGSVGNELSRRNEDDAGDGKHQHQGQRKKRIDRAIGDAILREQQRDRRIHEEWWCV